MRKVFLGFCLSMMCFLSQAQEITPEFDYQQNPHEFGLDVLSVFQGNNSMGLFYRKNYTREDGGMRGFRMIFHMNNQFSSFPEYFYHQQFDRRESVNYYLSLGKEWQKLTHSKIIAYGGYDAGFGYASRKLRDSGSNFPSGLRMQKNHSYNYFLTGFGGVKYHVHSRISLSAEFGLVTSYHRNIEVSTYGSEFNPTVEKEASGSFGLNLLPLRAFRLSYHF
jgi:hypothetical protein